jgi:spoIIIJ-associated protein
MNARREFEGKDLEGALRNASGALGIPEDDVHYEIVEQGRRGVLGLGGKAVRIRVKPPLDDPEVAPKPAGQPVERLAEAVPASPQEQGDAAVALEVRETLQRMLDLMELEVDATSQQRGNGVSLELNGEDRKLLLGRDSELLSAFQFLLNRMSRRAWPGAGRIQVSCAGHDGANRRDEEIVELVREVAGQVARTGRTNTLHPLNSYERRLAHLTVREFTGLTSSSDGDGSLKRIRISKVKNTVR